MTCYCLAVGCADLDLVRLYTSTGGDVHRRTNSGVTLCYLAASAGAGQGILDYLMGCGARMTDFERGVTGLSNVTDRERVMAILKELLGENPGLVNDTGDQGLTLLHHAIHNFQYAVVSMLLERGANPNALTFPGQSPLGLCRRSTEEGRACCALLRGKGARLTEREQIRVWIVEGENQQVIHALERAPHLVHAWDPSVGPFLHVAAWLAEGTVVLQHLLGHGVSPDVPNEEGETALHRACHRPEVVRLLIEHGANIDKQDDRGYTPLHAAVAMGAAESVKMLVRCGADVAARDDEGQTPVDILYAIQYPGFESLAKFLKTQGMQKQ